MSAGGILNFTIEHGECSGTKMLVLGSSTSRASNPSLCRTVTSLGQQGSRVRLRVQRVLRVTVQNKRCSFQSSHQQSALDGVRRRGTEIIREVQQKELLREFREQKGAVEKLKFLKEKGKLFVKMAWDGAKNFYHNWLVVRQIYDRVRDGTATRKEWRLVMITQQDWKKIIPILFWIKILPFSSLYVPFILMAYPMVLPSTFNIALMAGLESKVYLFDSLRDRRTQYLTSITPEEKNLEALRFLRSKPIFTSQELIDNLPLFVRPQLEIGSLNRQQLQAVLMGMGSSAMTMRFWPRFFMAQRLIRHFDFIYADDLLLTPEEIYSMSNEELIETNLERGLHVRPCTKEELQDQLFEWLKLSKCAGEDTKKIITCYHAFEMLKFRLASKPETRLIE